MFLSGIEECHFASGVETLPAVRGEERLNLLQCRGSAGDGRLANQQAYLAIGFQDAEGRIGILIVTVDHPHAEKIRPGGL